MDIYSIQSHMNKIKKYVEEIESSNTVFYSRSRNHLKTLSEDLIDTADKLRVIIGDTAMDDSDIEFDTLDNSAHIPHSSVTSKDRKIAFSAYSNVLKKVSNQTDILDSASTCSKLLSRWFTCRFVNRSTESSFLYKFESIPSWIYSIVIEYGKHIESGNVSSYIDDFIAWCDSIDSNQIYAVPFETNRIMKDPYPEDMTLTAVVLWDVLVDAGYRNLTYRSPTQLYLDDEYIYNLCGELNPAILDDYVHYRDDNSILERCKLKKG